MKISKFLFQHLLSILWAALILYGTVLSTPKVNPSSWIKMIPFMDKWVHLGLFFIFNFILFLEQKKHSNKNSFYYFVNITIGIIYGGVIELLQAYFTTNRHAEWLDWIADIMGVMLAYWVFKTFLKILKKA